MSNLLYKQVDNRRDLIIEIIIINFSLDNKNINLNNNYTSIINLISLTISLFLLVNIIIQILILIYHSSTINYQISRLVS